MGSKRVRPTIILVLTSLGFFMAMMDSMIVTTASTAIRTDFKVSVTTLQWALNAYNIAIAATLLVGVALGEQLGRRKIYNLGLLVFTLGSVFCALATNMTGLIIARIIEGVGASVITPLSMAILTNALPVSKRGRALGIWGGIGGLALIVGPSLGGLIVAKLTWQWIFWINVPIGIIVIYLAMKLLPESKGATQVIHFGDGLAVILATTGMIWGLSAITTPKQTAVAISVLLGSLIAGGWFINHQQHEVAPMMPLSAFKSRSFVGGNLATFLLYASMYGVVFFLPQFLQIAGRTNALQAGLELLPWTGTLVIVAPFAGKAVDRFGERPLAIGGLLLQGGGYLLLALLASYKMYILLVLPLVLAGSGLSMAGPALQKAVLGAVDQTNIGKASGIYNMFRLLGGAVGTTAAVLTFNKFGNITNPPAFLAGFQATMITTGLLSIFGVGFALMIHSRISRPAKVIAKA